MDPLSVLNAASGVLGSIRIITQTMRKHTPLQEMNGIGHWQDLQKEIEHIDTVVETVVQRSSTANDTENREVVLERVLNKCANVLQRAREVMLSEPPGRRSRRKFYSAFNFKNTIEQLIGELHNHRETLVKLLQTDTEEISQRSFADLSQESQSTIYFEPQGLADIDDDFQYGLGVFNDPPQAEYDIIFVHGLNGHPKGTWQCNDVPAERCVLWPRDFLKEDFPKARVFSYGYDYARRLTSEFDITHVTDIAKRLSSELLAQRKDTPLVRPLVWVAHSLGGLIVKAALQQAWRHRSMDDPQGVVFNATTGIIFLGTPHRADVTPAAAWAKTLRQITRITAPQTRPSSHIRMDNLEPENAFLQNSAFNYLIEQGQFKVYSFFENSQIATDRGPVVIADFSTTLGSPSEITNYLPGNHVTLCKFQNSSEPGYWQVSKALSSILADGIQSRPGTARSDSAVVSQASSEVSSGLAIENESLHLGRPLRRKELRKFKQYLDVSGTVRKAIPPRDLGSCTWILGSEAFTRWRDGDDHRVLSIVGPSGCGKTVLAKFVVEHLEQRLRRGDGSTTTTNSETINTTVLHFFYSGKKQESSAIRDLLHSFLSQLLDINPEFIRYVPSSLLRIYGHSNERARPVNASSEIKELSDVILLMLRDSEHGYIFCVFDGLDECDQDSLEPLLNLLTRFTSDKKMHVKVFMTLNEGLFALHGSMFIGWYNLQSPSTPSLNLVSEEGYKNDFISFITPRLKQLMVTRGLSSDLRFKITSELEAHYQEGFLWANLVMQIIASYSSMIEVKTFTATIPSTLIEIYQHLWSSIQVRTSTRTSGRPSIIQALSFLCFAMRTMQVEDLAVGLTLYDSEETFQTLDDVLHRKPLGLEEELRAELGALLKFHNDYVSFASLSFKCWVANMRVIESPGAEVLEKERLGDTSEEHGMMAKACLRFLRISTAPGEALVIPNSRRKETFPFRKYAYSYWPDHLRLAQQKASTMTTTLVKLWDSSARQQIFLDLFPKSFQKSPVSESLPLILASLDLPFNLTIDPPPDWVMHTAATYLSKRPSLMTETMRAYIKERARGFSRTEQLLTPGLSILESAELWEVIQGNHQLPEAQVELLIESNTLNHFLIAAIRYQRNASMKSIVDHGSQRIQELKLYRPALEEAANVPNIEAVGWILEHFEVSSFGRSLHIAARKSDLELTELLLEYGANSNERDMLDQDQTALHIAASTGNLTLLNLLISWRAKPSLEDKTGRTPLHRAAEQGHRDIVRRLCEISSQVNGADESGRTPLFAACEHGHYHAAKLLLDFGSKISRSNTASQTPLHVACSSGKVEIVELLLDAGSDPNAQITPPKTDMANRTLTTATPTGAVQNDHRTEQLSHSSITGDDAAIDQSRTPLGLIGAQKETTGVTRQTSSETKQAIDLENAYREFPNPNFQPLPLRARNTGGVPGNVPGVEKLTAPRLGKGHYHMTQNVTESSELELAWPMINRLEGQRATTQNSTRDMELDRALTAPGGTPLHLAALFGWDAMALVLLEAGAKINARNSHGQTPLHYACGSNHFPESTIVLLIGKGADLSIPDHKAKRLPLHYAAACSNAAIVTQLSAYDSKMVDIKDVNGNTPLHLAALRQDDLFESVAKALILSHADLYLSNSASRRPYDLIRKHENQDAANNLIKFIEEQNLHLI